jgi:hypothetical protein
MMPWDETHPLYDLTAEEAFGEDVRPDLAYWTKAAYWTIEEGVALSFGMEPRIVNWAAVKDMPGHPFVQAYRRRVSLAFRAMKMGRLEERSDPLEFVCWAHETGLEFDAEVEQALRHRVPSGADDHAGAEGATGVGGGRQRPSSNSDTAAEEEGEDELPLRAYRTLLRMILGMAMDKYRFDPKGSRQHATAGIARALERLEDRGVRVGDDTVRKWLSIAVEEVWTDPK